MDDPAADADVRTAQTVYDDEGAALGTVRGITEDGFLVTTRDGVEALSVEHEHPEADDGAAELLWRCLSCGEVGPVDEMPEECPSCGADKEDIYYHIED